MSALGSTFSGSRIAFRPAAVGKAAARPVVTVEAKRVCQLTGEPSYFSPCDHD
jgi:hypothetical protein